MPRRERQNQQIGESVGLAEFCQRAAFASAENRELARLAPDQRAGCRDDVDVATTGAEQPVADAAVKRFVNCLKRRCYGRESARMLLVQCGERVRGGQRSA